MIQRATDGSNCKGRDVRNFITMHMYLGTVVDTQKPTLTARAVLCRNCWNEKSENKYFLLVTIIVFSTVSMVLTQTLILKKSQNVWSLAIYHRTRT